jgi:hypothetical protein
MSSVALFVTWGTVEIPNYTQYYIEQLIPWFDEVVVITNEDRPVDVSWFESRNVTLKKYPNLSRDFEKYYYWMMEMGKEKVMSYSKLAIVNDSIICYGPITNLMNWIMSRGEEVVGLNGSEFPHPHIQSYFLMFQGAVLERVWNHFNETGIVEPMKEIEEYELKLTSLAHSVEAMFPMGKRRGWDELFGVPFDKGVPLVKHHCIMPRKPIPLNVWRRRIDSLAHPDTKAWQYLPLLGDKKYTHRTESPHPHLVLFQKKDVVTVQQTHQQYQWRP